MSSSLNSITRVHSAKGSTLGRLREIAARRELLVNLVRLELRSKYKASALGFFWSLLNPAMYLVVFYIAFDLILGGGIPRFPIYLLSGLLCWNFFTTALNAGTGSIVAASGLVKKVWFPREILPLASVGAALVHFFLQSLVLISALAIMRHPVDWDYITLLPVALFALVLLAASLVLLLSAANVYLRDVAHFVELALLGWFWVTPIVYAFTNIIKAVHGHTAFALLNPVTPIVLTFQRAFYGDFHRPGEPPIMPESFKFGWYARNLALVIAGGLVMLYISLRSFRRLEGNIAEEL